MKISLYAIIPPKMSFYVWWGWCVTALYVFSRQSNKRSFHRILRRRWIGCPCDYLVIAGDIPHLFFELKSDFVKICGVSESYFMGTLSVMMVISGGWTTLMDSLAKTGVDQKHIVRRFRGYFKNAYELLNLREITVHKMHIFQCMGKIFGVEFQRVPLKFHTNYLTHTLKDAIFIQHWNFNSSMIESALRLRYRSLQLIQLNDKSTNIGISVTSHEHQGDSYHWHTNCLFYSWIKLRITTKKHQSSALLTLFDRNPYPLVTGRFPS